MTAPPRGGSASSEAEPLYADAAYYGMMFDARDHDLSFYERLVPRAGRLLELGVGTGRVAVALARNGAQVVGVDNAEAMLEQLARRVAAEPNEVQRRVTWHLGDVRTVRLTERFSLVTYPFNGLAHHHEEQQRTALFATVRDHLTPQGRFAFDVVRPDPQVLAGGSASAPWFRHPATNEVCRCDSTTTYDEARRVLTSRVTIRFLEVERPAEVLEWKLRQWFPEEIPPLLERQGFELVEPPGEMGDAVAYVARVKG